MMFWAAAITDRHTESLQSTAAAVTACNVIKTKHVRHISQVEMSTEKWKHTTSQKIWYYDVFVFCSFTKDLYIFILVTYSSYSANILLQILLILTNRDRSVKRHVSMLTKQIITDQFQDWLTSASVSVCHTTACMQCNLFDVSSLAATIHQLYR